MINWSVLRNLRKKLQKTQEEMADELYVAQSTYSRYESGKCTPSMEMVCRIVETFGIRLNSLVKVKPSRRVMKKRPARKKR